MIPGFLGQGMSLLCVERWNSCIFPGLLLTLLSDSKFPLSPGLPLESQTEHSSGQDVVGWE